MFDFWAQDKVKGTPCFFHHGIASKAQADTINQSVEDFVKSIKAAEFTKEIRLILFAALFRSSCSSDGIWTGLQDYGNFMQRVWGTEYEHNFTDNLSLAMGNMMPEFLDKVGEASLTSLKGCNPVFNALAMHLFTDLESIDSAAIVQKVSELSSDKDGILTDFITFLLATNSLEEAQSILQQNCNDLSVRMPGIKQTAYTLVPQITYERYALTRFLITHCSYIDGSVYKWRESVVKVINYFADHKSHFVTDARNKKQGWFKNLISKFILYLRALLNLFKIDAF